MGRGLSWIVAVTMLSAVSVASAQQDAAPWHLVKVTKLSRPRPGTSPSAVAKQTQSESQPLRYLHIEVAFSPPLAGDSMHKFRVTDQQGRPAGEIWGFNKDRSLLIFERPHEEAWTSLAGLYLDGLGHREPLFVAAQPALEKAGKTSPPVVHDGDTRVVHVPGAGGADAGGHGRGGGLAGDRAAGAGVGANAPTGTGIGAGSGAKAGSGAGRAESAGQSGGAGPGAGGKAAGECPTAESLASTTRPAGGDAAGQGKSPADGKSPGDGVSPSAGESPSAGAGSGLGGGAGLGGGGGIGGGSGGGSGSGVGGGTGYGVGSGRGYGVAGRPESNLGNGPMADAGKAAVGYPAEIPKTRPEMVLYLSCGDEVGPGKVYQVSDSGSVLGIVNLPSTATGLALHRQHGLVAALPLDGGKLMRIDETGKVSTILEKSQSLVHPIDVGIAADSDTLVVADNITDALMATTIEGTRPHLYRRFDGLKWERQAMSVAVTTDKHVIFGTDGNEGIYRFAGDNYSALRGPLLPERGGVAADTASIKWAATQSPNHICVFEGEELMTRLRLPPNKSVYRGGLLSFAPAGSVVVAVRDSDDVEDDPWLIQYPTEEGKGEVRSLFEWKLDHMVDFVVGPRMVWERHSPSKYESIY